MHISLTREYLGDITQIRYEKQYIKYIIIFSRPTEDYAAAFVLSEF